jgi:hypothetical protein
MADYCPKGHYCPTSAHRDAGGTCKECKRLHALKRKAAYEVCLGLERYGVRFENEGVPVSAEEVAAQLVRLHRNN